ncbi:GGDEF domain-containing protein [Arthrobacter sp. NyZ413]|uniref:GGDEF domain-containing protein n=1 Tax=Arthrobacter sp. NyZ413 TaxID=3144669 RepID=UPI003BF8C4D2
MTDPGAVAGYIALSGFSDKYRRLARTPAVPPIQGLLRPRGRASPGCRYGGEEFIILLPGAHQESAWIIAETINRHLAAAKPPQGVTFPTVSYGIATRCTVCGDLSPMVVEAADRALYEAKGLGRNRIDIHPAPPDSPTGPRPVCLMAGPLAVPDGVNPADVPRPPFAERQYLDRCRSRCVRELSVADRDDAKLGPRRGRKVL